MIWEIAHLDGSSILELAKAHAPTTGILQGGFFRTKSSRGPPFTVPGGVSDRLIVPHLTVEGAFSQEAWASLAKAVELHPERLSSRMER